MQMSFSVSVTFANAVPASILAATLPATPATAAASTSATEHGKFNMLKQEFKSLPKAAKACLICHPEFPAPFTKNEHRTGRQYRN